MSRRVLLWAGLVAALLALAGAATAGQAGGRAQAAAAEQAVYTYVAFWSVPRADWSAVEDYYKASVPLMKKLMDAGTILGWGQARAFVHDQSGVTHLDWFTARGFADLAKTLDAIRAAGPLPAAFGNAKHHDEIVRSTVGGGKPGAAGSGMLWVARYELQAGQTEDFTQLFEDEIKPLFEEQTAAGTILSYSLSFEAIHTESPSVVAITYVLPDAAAIDKFQSALEKYEVLHPRAGAALEAVMNLAAHRDALFEVLAFGKK
jgi:hypothetical protein